MNIEKTVVNQLMLFFPDYELNKCIIKYKGNYKVRTFTCCEHFYVMIFTQLTYRESLGDIATCLKALSGNLYHSGIKWTVFKSTLAEANENGDWHIYADFVQVVITDARKLYKTDNDSLLDDNNLDHTLDSIFRKTKATVKAHVLLDISKILQI